MELPKMITNSETSNLNHLLQLYERCIEQDNSASVSYKNRKIDLLPSQELKKNLELFQHDQIKGHDAFICALKAASKKNPTLLERGIKVIQSDHFETGQTPEQKKLILNELNHLLCPSVELSPVISKSLKTEENIKTFGNEKSSRSDFGGKGMFLNTIKEMGLSVPPFESINTQTVKTIENCRFNTDIVKKFIPDFPCNPSDTKTTLGQLTERISALPPMQKTLRESWLSQLAELICSDQFYQVLKHVPELKTIDESYQQLIEQEKPPVPVIVRSSGVHEDNYGDSQAGKYQSCVKGHEPVLKTCLKVMASGYQPHVCPTGKPQPFAMVMQRCIDCAFGGVVFSRSSLQDDSIRVEYAPGQPKTAVAGNEHITPHQYRLTDLNNNQSVPMENSWHEGQIKEHYVLHCDAEGHYCETLITNSVKEQQLSPEILEQLRQATRQLEDRLRCPVDVEFAVDKKDRLYILQVRPVTQLTGGSSFDQPLPEEAQVKGELISEGLCSGEPIAVDRLIKDNNGKIDAQSIPNNAIIFTDQGDDSLLEPHVLKKVNGFILRTGGVNSHFAITARQQGKPCLVAGDNYQIPKNKNRVTLLAGNFKGEAGACVLEGEHQPYWLQHRSQLTQDYSVAITQTDNYKPVNSTFKLPQEGFNWLSQQNDRLLSYFDRNRLFNHCLGSEQSRLFSMSADRQIIASKLQLETEHFCQDAEALLAGYERFINLAGDCESAEIKNARQEIMEIKEKLKTLTTAIKQQIQPIIGMFNDDKNLTQEGYCQWLVHCQELESTLQSLSQPSNASTIKSVHDVIFLIHKRFVDHLPTVAEQSGAGKAIGFAQNNVSGKWVNFLQEGEQGLMTKDVQKALQDFQGNDLTVLDMPSAFRVNATLGIHVCEAAMFEQADGGKNRKIRLTLSDEFSDSEHQSGKFQRCFFLMSALALNGWDRSRMTANF